MPSSWRLAATWRLLVLAALLDGHGVPGTVLTAPATCQYLAGQDARRSAGSAAGLVGAAGPAAGRAGGHRCGGNAAGRVGEPGAAGGGPRRRAAGTGWPRRPGRRPRRWRRCGRMGQPRSPLAAVLRACAASVRRAAGDALWAGGGCPWLLLAAGHSLDGAGLAGPAVAWWRELTADSQRILGPGHPDTLMAGSLLAEALLAAGQAAEAVTWFGWALAGCTDVLGPDHPATLAAPVSLGRALVAAGEPGEAVRLLEQAARHSERVRGPGDAGTWAAWDQYAAACLAAGQARRGDRLLPADAGRPRAPVRAGSSRHPGRPAAAGRRLAWPRERPRMPSPSAPGSWPAGSRCWGPITRIPWRRAPGWPRPTMRPGRWAPRCSSIRWCAPGTSASSAPITPPPWPAARTSPTRTAPRASSARQWLLLREAIARSEQALSPGDPLTLALRQALADITGEMTAR